MVGSRLELWYNSDKTTRRAGTSRSSATAARAGAGAAKVAGLIVIGHEGAPVSRDDNLYAERRVRRERGRPRVSRVACVQFRAKRRESLDDLVARVGEVVARSAAGLGADMVVFPAYTGLAYLAAAFPGTNLFLGPGFGAAVAKVFSSSQGSDAQTDFLRLFSRLAARYHVYIAPGTIPVPAPGGVRNEAHLISPDGDVIGTQAQTHLSRDERASGFVRWAEGLEVFPTSLGMVGFAVCEDAWYPEVMRILALQGAQIVLAPTAVPAPYSEWYQARGMWQNVQQNQVFGVEACLVGLVGGVEFEGRSTIYATCEMTEGDTGVLARAARTTAEDIVVADLSFPSIRGTIERFPIFRHLNHQLYSTWFPQVYLKHTTAGGAAAAVSVTPSGGAPGGTPGAPPTPASAPASTFGSPSAHPASAARASTLPARARPAPAPPRAGERAAVPESAPRRVAGLRIASILRGLALKALLRWASRPAVVQGYLAKKRIAPSDTCASLISGPGRGPGETGGPGAATGSAYESRLPMDGRPSKVRVAAVQMRLDLIKDARSYAEKIYGLTKSAVDQGAQLVVFPEDSGTPLVGLLPGIDKLAAKGIDAAVADMAGGDVEVSEVFRVISPAVKRIYETTFSTLARAFRVYIITGSAFLEDDDGKMRVIGYFYGPDGELIARQRKLHLVPMEAAWGFEPGSDLEVVDTPLGRIAFPICMDATYFETFRIARLRGADIVVIPSANNEEYLFWRTMRGIWPRVQESQVLGVSAAAVGSLLGIPFTGRSGLLAPLEMTPSGDGWLARAASFDQEEVVVGDLDLDALHRFRDENPLDFNVRLYTRYLPALYSRGIAR
ncbi:MAG: nitrilase-related carbon-nitrogen hydrolase [Betaproteobacteria bacterium]